MSLPTTIPKALIATLDRRGLWPTSMRYREEGGQLVGTVEQWGRKARLEEPIEPPKSRRGVVGQGALDL